MWRTFEVKLRYLKRQNLLCAAKHWETHSRQVEWTERDLNPRLPPCEGGDHTRLIYRPVGVFLWRKLPLQDLELSVSRRMSNTAFSLLYWYLAFRLTILLRIRVLFDREFSCKILSVLLCSCPCSLCVSANLLPLKICKDRKDTCNAGLRCCSQSRHCYLSLFNVWWCIFFCRPALIRTIQL